MKKRYKSILSGILLIMIFFSPAVLAAGQEGPTNGLDPLKDLFSINTAQTIDTSYRSHVQNVGWETSWASNGLTSGTSGRGLRLEGIQINLTGTLPEGAEIEYRTHVENIGWEPSWSSNGNTAGSFGRGLRLEAIQIRLVNMPGYSVEYRTHVQNEGWETNWVKNGEISGTQGQGLRLEGIQIRIIKEAADLTAYKNILATVNSAAEENYTTYSWANLQTVVANNAVTTKNTQQQINTATDNIQAAYDALESEALATVYETAGTYGPASGIAIVNKDVVIKAAGVTLQNQHIKGDLIISEEVGAGDATLNNVTVDGDTFVRGGGKNSIHIYGGSYQKITIQNTSNGQVRIVATGVDGLEVVIAEDAEGENVILEGDFDSVQVDALSMNVSTQGATTIKEMTIGRGGAGCQLDLDSNTRVDKLIFNSQTDVTGQGRVVLAAVYVDDITYEKAPDEQTVAANVKVPPKIPGVSVTSVTVSSEGSVTTLKKDETVQMTATVLPVTAVNKNVTWTVVNGSGKATVSSTGLLTGVSIGTVTVKATAQDGSGEVGTKVMTIDDYTSGTIATTSTIANGATNPTIVITLINDTFTANSYLTSNWTISMGATGLTVGALSKISDSQLVIYTKGTAAPGNVSLTANAGALVKKNASNTISLSVTGIDVSAILVSGTGNATTVKKGSSLQMLASVTPSNATNKSVIWSVTNGTGTASISSTGLLIGVTAGSVTVNATAADGSGKYDTQIISVQNLTIASISTVSIINKGTVNPSIVVTLLNDTFTDFADSKINWTVTPGTTGLTVSSIARNSDTQVTINTTGTAAAGTLTLTANAGALTGNTASSTLSAAVVVQPVTVTAALQSATNAAGQTVNVKSSQGTGAVYIILAGITQNTAADFEMAVVAKKGAKAAVSAANTDISVSTEGLAAGTYYAYAVDGVGTISAKGTNAITVTAADILAPTLSSVTAGPVAAGDDIAATSSEAGYLYLVPVATMANKTEIEAAGVAINGTKIAATAGDSKILSTTGFVAGDYLIYAIDEAGNVSTGSAVITIS